MSCECDEPGFCKKHGIYKNKIMHEQCKLCPLSFAMFEKPEVVEGPSFPRKVMNYAIAEVKHTLSGRKEVTGEVYEKRMSICKLCPLFEAVTKVCLHQDCGCYLEIKAKWADSECPVGEWSADGIEPKSCGGCGK